MIMTGDLTMASVKFLFLSSLGLYWGIASPLVLAQSVPSPYLSTERRISQPIPNSLTPIELPVPGIESSPNPSVMPSAGLNPEAGNPIIPSTAYTLAVGDRIFIRVINVPEYSAEYQVQPDGTIGLPVVGGVSVWGMTVQQVAQEVTQRYTESDVLRNPSISVTLLAVSPLRIVIAGEVNRPGAYALGVTDGKLPTVTQAIQQAGGMTQQADLRQVQIIRPQRSGKDEKLQVNLWEMLRNGDARQDVLLHDGDSIVLATAAAIDPAESHLLGNANLSPEAIQVGIVGEVRQAGTIQVPPNTPLNQAILAAGGFNHRARSSVILIRLNPNGTVTQRQIRVDFSENINETTNPILRNRDVIVVRRSTLATIGDTLGTILGPVGQGFSLFGLFNSLFPKSSP
jgi:polysaccharide export outer membrane protein